MNGGVRVIHYRDRGALGPDEQLVYIGRANSRYRLNASPLANPFTLKEHGDNALARATAHLQGFLPSVNRP